MGKVQLCLCIHHATSRRQGIPIEVSMVTPRSNSSPYNVGDNSFFGEGDLVVFASFVVVKSNSSLAFRKDARYSRTGQNVVFGLAVSQS